MIQQLILPLKHNFYSSIFGRPSNIQLDSLCICLRIQYKFYNCTCLNMICIFLFEFVQLLKSNIHLYKLHNIWHLSKSSINLGMISSYYLSNNIQLNRKRKYFDLLADKNHNYFFRNIFGILYQLTHTLGGI